MWRKALCLCLAVIMTTTSLLAQQPEVDKARMDAERDAKTDVSTALWMGAGCLLGVVGILVAYVIEPSPPVARLLGKSPEYVAVYTETYKSVAKNTQTKHAITGCAIAHILGGVSYLLFYGLILAAAPTY